MGNKETEEGAKLRRYCAKYGVTERTGRTHRAKNVESWARFEVDVPVDAKNEDLMRAGAMKAAAWRHYEGLVAQYDRAVKQGSGADTLGKLERACRFAQARYHEAQKEEESLRQRLSLLVPYESVMGLERAIAPLGLLFKGLKDKIGAGIADADSRLAFYRAFDGAVPEWNDAVSRITHQMRALLPC